MRFAVNLSMLFTELPLLERPEAAKKAGFDAVECWWPFDIPEPGDKEVEVFLAAIADAGVRLTGLNFDAGPLADGYRGFVSQPDRSGRFRANVPAAVDMAGRTGCQVLNALYGNRQKGVSPRLQDACALENLQFAAEAARGVATVVLEPLNSFESPHYPLVRTAHAVEVIERVREAGGDRLGLLYDVYHMQRMEGNLIDNLRRHSDHLTHVQIADSPGRGAPGTGEIAFARVLDALHDVGYQGTVGLEYKAGDAAPHRFDWLHPEGRGDLAGRRISEFLTV
ncbi:hydroxypyruvate isomerase [Spinactinospora alkalitolerans]|uniref:Hydroxypyruvate isomerase n=1 Tax=Spinactinospora alkalitolerans TaxID=687207 RepID=A0A852TWU4_9ACTN|nr:TIM barrel protein [Spinactinospora alkalitolerans]NYE48489.1 hydroxypyruvate isomerase [Spinactinospora alkalitolerans]